MISLVHILMICGGLVFSEAAVIIILNTKRGYWETLNKLHVLSAAFFLIYLTTVIYSYVECTRSDFICGLLWKICSTCYISVSMAVYSFYYVKSRLVNNILWEGKQWCGRVVATMIPLMAVFGLCFFWMPSKEFTYFGYLKDGECKLVERRWIVIFWVVGDVILSILLLLLFIRPITVIKKTLNDTPRSAVTLRSMKKLTERNRNLLLFTVTVTITLFTIVAVVSPDMRAVICIGMADRLVTLQCITMTFSYDGREYFYCRACFLLCFQTRTPEMEQEENDGYEAMSEQNLEYQGISRDSNSLSLHIMSSSTSEIRAEN